MTKDNAQGRALPVLVSSILPSSQGSEEESESNNNDTALSSRTAEMKNAADVVKAKNKLEDEPAESKSLSLTKANPANDHLSLSLRKHQTIQCVNTISQQGKCCQNGAVAGGKENCVLATARSVEGNKMRSSS